MIGIALDIDWAPDFVIDSVARKLIEARTPATWFVTHQSKAVARLAERPDLFELGIHPNFLPGSTHGKSVDEVLDAVMKMAPEAVSMRTHGLVQSTSILDRVMALTPIKIDASMYLAHASGVEVVDYWWNGRHMTRVPFIWEDDLEWQRPKPVWQAEKMVDRPGIKVFAFHPMHVFLNSKDPSAYNVLKGQVKNLGELEQAEAMKLIQTGPGAGSFFQDLIKSFKLRGRIFRIAELAEARARL